MFPFNLNLFPTVFLGQLWIIQFGGFVLPRGFIRTTARMLCTTNNLNRDMWRISTRECIFGYIFSAELLHAFDILLSTFKLAC